MTVKTVMGKVGSGDKKSL